MYNALIMPVLADKIFYFLTFVALLSALLVVFSKKPMHSVLFLIITFFCLSGHYVLLNAQFLAAVNIIVYAGAIMVLFLFTIMFLNLKNEEEDKRSAITQIIATVSGGTLLVLMVAVLRQTEMNLVANREPISNVGLVESLGKVLFRDYLLPFELASVLFLAAMVGAVMLGKRDPGDKVI
ncbi:MAG: NADH-quinone oxidoreductase subunit J [Cytophagales bacterium]|nr:MAG: NADH-quinone oxidoreductase subunit J [Cytophagales bacterium]TAF59438.1 MAG: NADH-quinone oxidoreductase subunit J [Cytophagales bacterium]